MLPLCVQRKFPDSNFRFTMAGVFTYFTANMEKDCDSENICETSNDSHVTTNMEKAACGNF